MKPTILLLALFFSAGGPTAHAAHITLEDYLEQVAAKNPGITAARRSGQGSSLRAEGAEVLTFPYAFGRWNTLNDKQETAFPAQQGIGTQINYYTLGLGWDSSFGLNAKYSFNATKTDIAGATMLPTHNYNTAYNRLDLTQSLVKNGFGSQIRAQKDALRARHEAEVLGSSYQNLGQLVTAELAYWRLAFARQSVQMQRDVLTRAERLLQWARRRVGLQLGDQSDLLQAQASFDLHRLELGSALEEEKNAGRSFNSLRYSEGEAVEETLALPSLEETLHMPSATRTADRLDLQSAAAQTRARQAQAQLDKEALKPSVDLVATYAWNGRDNQKASAIREAFGSEHPTKAIGLNFSVPLNVSTWKRAMQGADLEIEAAHYELEQRRLDEAKDWAELNSLLADARARLVLLRTIEEGQRQKYENERQRLLRGRSTTYQALTFEQDYSNSQLLRLRTQAEVLQVLARLKLYRGNP